MLSASSMSPLVVHVVRLRCHSRDGIIVIVNGDALLAELFDLLPPVLTGETAVEVLDFVCC